MRWVVNFQFGDAPASDAGAAPRVDTVRRWDLGAVTDQQDGSRSAGVHQAYASELIKAFDPNLESVVVEGHAPALAGWQTLPLPVTPDAGTSLNRVVRNLRFDLLATPAELREIGDGWDISGDGALYAWQTATRPPEHLSLLQKDHAAKLSAQLGVNVQLLVNLPHAEETAVLWGPTRALLDAALDRLSL